MKGGVAVDYKTPKRMKKRRQLDALVDTVKLPRTRKNSTSAQELLDSDSSEIDEFTLPQVGSRRKNRCCSCQSTFTCIGLFVISMACLTTCVGLIWVQWHIRHEINLLRKQIETVQNTDTAAADFLKIKAEVAAVNSTVTNGKESLRSINQSIALIQERLEQVEETTKTLTLSIGSASKYREIPKRINGMSDILADIGSKVKTLTQTTDDLADRVGKIEAASKETEENSASPNDIGAHSQFEEILAEGLANVNVTMATRLSDMSQVLEKQEERISALEASSQSEAGHNNDSKLELDKEEINTLLTQLVAEKMASITLAPETSTTDVEDLSALKESVQNISLAQKIVFDDIQSQTGKFLAFKQDVLGNFEQLNETLLTMDEELDGLARRFDIVEASIGNMTAAVMTLKNTPAAEETAYPVSEEGTGKNDAADETLHETKQAASEPLHIDGINTLEELQAAFDSWPVDDGGYVTMEFLAQQLKEHVDEDTLKKYDTDTDERFSELEIAKALGFEEKGR